MEEVLDLPRSWRNVYFLVKSAPHHSAPTEQFLSLLAAVILGNECLKFGEQLTDRRL